MNVVLRYFKLAGVAVGVWLSGYLNFSPSWLLVGLVLYVWKERQGKRKKLQIEIRQDTARDEQKAILARVEDLPSWVGTAQYMIVGTGVSVHALLPVAVGTVSMI